MTLACKANHKADPEKCLFTSSQTSALLDILTPLFCESGHNEFEPIINIVTGMLETGSLHCIHQVKEFVLQAGQVSY